MKNLIDKFENHYGSLASNVKQKVIHYSNDGYNTVNRYLFAPAFNKKSKAKANEYIDILDDAISFELPTSITVFKGVKSPMTDKIDQLKKNDTYQYKAYISTSLSKRIAKTFGKVLKINVPKGTKVMYIPNPINPEKEILIARNSTLKKISDNEFSLV